MITGFIPPPAEFTPPAVPRALQVPREATAEEHAGYVLLRKMTAPPRVAARIVAARAAADAWSAVGDAVPTDETGVWLEPWYGLVAATALAAECGGAFGGGTRRLPGFNRLGKGRRHATDGQAYDAAIHAAFRGSAYAMGTFLGVVLIAPDEFLAHVGLQGLVSAGALAELGDGSPALRAAKVLYEAGEVATALALTTAVAAARARATAEAAVAAEAAQAAALARIEEISQGWCSEEVPPDTSSEEYYPPDSAA